MNKVVAFLDLLGFKNYIKQDPNAALTLLANYHEIVNFRSGGERTYLPEMYKEYDEKYKDLNNVVALDSFEYLLPFSDSLLVVSSDPNKFLKQISIFLLDCFFVTSHQYSITDNTEDPTKVIVTGFSTTEDGGIQKNETSEHWYPTLFRGGITFDKVNVFKINSIEKHNLKQITNIVGRGTVNAVLLEKEEKGPRLICDSKFVDVLDDNSKFFVEPVKNADYFEILWPAIYYYLGNSDSSRHWKTVACRFIDIFTPAANLWKAFNHEEYSIQYYEFLKLIVRSSLKYFSEHESYIEIKEYFINEIRNNGMDLKLNDLIEN